jgi:protein-S-isoprenylcysteine O-methyltransferase Ste14
MTKRLAVFLYGLVSYIACLVAFLWAVGFVGNFMLPRSLDSVVRVPFWPALLTDVALLGIFAVQHSVMARPGFKRVLTRYIPEAGERSTYVLVSSLLMFALFVFWQPLGGVVWNVTDPAFCNAVNGIMLLGFGLLLITTFLINHFDLFGMRQVSLYLAGKPYTQLEFRTPLFYRYVRHPLYIGWLMFFWATPTMTGAHLLFAVLTTTYILLAIRWEERDLLMLYGAKYADYRKSVPKLIPSLIPYLEPKQTAMQKQRTAA